MPNLSGIEKIIYERYYLYIGNDIEIRIQRKTNIYEFERKVKTSELRRESQIFNITKDEFDTLKNTSGEAIIRDEYLFSQYPPISIQKYHDKFEGLVRIEIDFDTEKAATEFTAPDWFGSEITNSSLGRDSRLLGLNKEEFAKLLL